MSLLKVLKTQSGHLVTLRRTQINPKAQFGEAFEGKVFYCQKIAKYAFK